MTVYRIKVIVKFFLQFRDFLKKSKIEIELKEGADIFQVLESICNLYNLREKIFNEKNELRQWIRILKNGRQIKFLNGIRTKLRHGDVIALFPPTTGG